MSIISEIKAAVVARLQDELIENIPTDDLARASLVMAGPLQGDPMEPDKARIYVTVHENDPDRFYGNSDMAGGDWRDEVFEIETGGSITMRRRFSVKARALLVRTREKHDTAEEIIGTLRDRIENALIGLPLSGVRSGTEYVARGIVADENFSIEQIQAGGPGSFDYHIKVRFEVLTTRGYTP